MEVALIGMALALIITGVLLVNSYRDLKRRGKKFL